MKNFFDDPLLMCDDIEDTRKSTSINPTHGIYWFTAVVFLSIASQ